MKARFNPILPNFKNWPIVNITKNKSKFVQEIIQSSTNRIFKKYVKEEDISSVIIRVKNAELTNLQSLEDSPSNRRKKIFWLNVENELSNYKHYEDLNSILHSIISHYIGEISGSFSIYHYNLAKKCITYTLSRLLNPISLPSISRIAYMHKYLHDRIHIEGNVKQIRLLAKIGTVIMLPTHFSNIDSAVISWVIDSLGLPAFVYGAGINLFNKKFWNYTLSKVGTYKVDRTKKNPIYLTTLESYASTSIRWGCHSLFYPHGTRSRTGCIEPKLKTGLLSAVLNAQEQNYSNDGSNGRKLFLVPVSFNYPFVLEAPLFSKNCVSTSDIEGDNNHKASFHLYNKLIHAKNLLTKESYISVRFGSPIDIMGYDVDNNGNSYNSNGDFINTYELVLSELEKYYKSEEHVKHICKRITDEYYKSTTILCCHLVAYAAFALIKKKYPDLNPAELDMLSSEDLKINHSSLETTFSQLKNVALSLAKEKKVHVEKQLGIDSNSSLFQYGLKNIGVYHQKRPLVDTGDGYFTTHDLGTLIYYRNRLKDYEPEFEKFI
jgi:glycerol-3-phosphate O-acyltransferase